MFTATLLICTALSIGVEVNHQPQCALDGPGLIESRPIPGTFPDAARCANAAYDATKSLRSALAAKGQVPTWQCQAQ
jgi:hypothetical protein